MLDLITRPGGSYKVAAATLGLSVPTISKHVRSILRKLDVETYAQALRRIAEFEEEPFGTYPNG